MTDNDVTDNDAACVQFPECPECGARPGQAHTATCQVIDLDDVSGCPVADTCVWCSRVQPEAMVVGTFASQLGVSCGTVCVPCFQQGEPPDTYTLPTDVIARQVVAHCGHLGITVDQMADALEEDEETND